MHPLGPTWDNNLFGDVKKIVHENTLWVTFNLDKKKFGDGKKTIKLGHPLGPPRNNKEFCLGCNLAQIIKKSTSINRKGLFGNGVGLIQL
jgi:hypothetical protein